MKVGHSFKGLPFSNAVLYTSLDLLHYMANHSFAHCDDLHH